MDLSKHRDLLPHYVANLALVLAAVGAVRAFVGDLGVIVELVIVAVVVLVYPTLVRWLGVEPRAWRDARNDGR